MVPMYHSTTLSKTTTVTGTRVLVSTAIASAVLGLAFAGATIQQQWKSTNGTASEKLNVLITGKTKNSDETALAKKELAERQRIAGTDLPDLKAPKLTSSELAVMLNQLSTMQTANPPSTVPGVGIVRTCFFNLSWADYIVDNSSSTAYQDIHDALADAQVQGDKNSDNRILICVVSGQNTPAVYPGGIEIDLTQWPAPNYPLIIFSTGGPSLTHIRDYKPGSNTDHAIHVHDGYSNRKVTFWGFDVSEYSTADMGAALLVSDRASVSVGNMVFADNISEYRGGAAYVQNASLTIYKSSFLNNTAWTLGGAIAGTRLNGALYAQNPLLAIRQTTFEGNTAGGATDTLWAYGGAIDFWSGAFAVVESTFTSNSTAYSTGVIGGSGGGIEIIGAPTVYIASVEFDGNQSGIGGAISMHALPAQTVLIRDSQFTNNQSVDTSSPAGYGGGAIKNQVYAMTIINSSFENNYCGSRGGAIYSESADLTLTQTTFTGNSAQIYGGALLMKNVGVLNVSESSFTSNSADTSGGAIAIQQSSSASNYAGQVDSIVGSDFTDNTSAGNGGAVSVIPYSSLYLANTPGIPLTIQQSSFFGNEALNGSALATSTALDLDLTNVIMAGNNALTNGTLWSAHTVSGSGVTTTLTNVTVAGNTVGVASNTAGVYTSTPQLLTVMSSVLAWNGTAAPQLVATPTPNINYSIFFTPSGSAHVSPAAALTGGAGNTTVDPGFVGDASGTNPLLSTVIAGFNFHPASGSPMVDTGDPATMDWDSSATDRGAYGGPGGDW